MCMISTVHVSKLSARKVSLILVSDTLARYRDSIIAPQDRTTLFGPAALGLNASAMKAATAILCLLATVTVASAGRLISVDDLNLPTLGDAPDFCHGLECPPFKELKNTSKYQLREYSGGKIPAAITASIIRGYSLLAASLILLFNLKRHF